MAKDPILNSYKRGELALEFDTVKNAPLKFEDLSDGSSRKVWWSCRNAGHAWQAPIQSRLKRGRGCPYCAGQKPVVGVNDLPTLKPQLMPEWDPENDQAPESYMPYSTKKVGWVCQKSGHRWQARISSRSTGSGCPYCSGNSLEPERSLLAVAPSLAAELVDQTLASKIFASSATATEWSCENNHVWLARPADRLRGSGCPYCSGNQVWSGYNDLAFTDPYLAAELHPTLNGNFDPQTVSRGSVKSLWWQCSKGHAWQARVDSRALAKTGCPECKTSYQTSKPEHVITAHLRALGLKVIQNDRKALSNGQELDIYLPDLGMAIEFNGLYWHSELVGKSPAYHYNKYAAARQQGIQLIQIWEDDWRLNSLKVLSMLEHKLKVANTERLPARKTVIIEVNKKTAEKFLTKYHLQGYASGSKYLALQSKGENVAVMVLKQLRQHEFLISRYATNAVVQGGFSKLLKYVAINLKAERVLTFSDNAVSDGGLYASQGFIPEAVLPPDYMYIVQGRRIHKFRFRLNRFKTDPTLTFQDGLSERELARLNHLPRIWDAGKVRWVKTFAK